MEAEREEGTTRGSLTSEEDAYETHRGAHLDEETMAITEPPPLPSQRASNAPQLQLVPSPDGERAAWPFAEEDPSSLVAEPVRRRTGSLRPPSRVAPSERFGARDRRHNPTVGSGLRQFPLPPPTEFGSQDLNLRDEESVIAEARFVKNSSFDKVRQYARRASTVMSSQSYALATSLGEHSIAAIRKFEALPRKKQLIWVAAPYLLAVVLVLALLQVRSGSTEAATHAPDPANVAAAVDAPTDDVIDDIPLVPPRRVDASRKATTETSDDARPDVGVGITRVLPIRTRLFIRAEPGPHSAKLRAGTKVTVFPDFPALNGFVLAQSAKGTVGFLSVLHLEGKKDPSVAKKRKKRRRRRSRR